MGWGGRMSATGRVPHFLRLWQIQSLGRFSRKKNLSLIFLQPRFLRAGRYRVNHMYITCFWSSLLFFISFCFLSFLFCFCFISVLFCFMLLLELFVDAPLNFSCPADYVADWQPCILPVVLDETTTLINFVLKFVL